MTVYVVVAIAVGVLVAIGVFRLMWRVAEPNEALIISGARHRTEGLDEGMPAKPNGDAPTAAMEVEKGARSKS